MQHVIGDTGIVEQSCAAIDRLLFGALVAGLHPHGCKSKRLSIPQNGSHDDDPVILHVCMCKLERPGVIQHSCHTNGPVPSPAAWVSRIQAAKRAAVLPDGSHNNVNILHQRLRSISQ